MYVILVYDFKERRVQKMLKLCRKYLLWIQNSVFEGEISEARLKDLLNQANNFMEPDEDSIIIFRGKDKAWMNKEIIGREKGSTDIFL